MDQSSLPGKGWAGQSWVQDSTAPRRAESFVGGGSRRRRGRRADRSDTSHVPQACWMNNFHDLIRLQNELYWKRELYLDNSVPTSDFDFVKNPNNALKYQGLEPAR